MRFTCTGVVLGLGQANVLLEQRRVAALTLWRLRLDRRADT
jgi:hypothetical protein